MTSLALPVRRGRRSPKGRYLSLGFVAAALAVLTASSTVSATTWGTVINVTNNGLAVTRTFHQLAASGNTVHLLYDYVNNGTVGYRKSNAGINWTAHKAIQVGDANTLYQALAIAASGDNVVALYRLDKNNAHSLYFRRSDDAGATWKPRVTLATFNHADFSQRAADIAISGSLVVAAWTNAVTGAIVTRRSTDGGATWKAPVNAGTTTYGYFVGKEGSVTVALAGTRLYVAWISAKSTNDKTKGITLRRSTNGGQSFLAAQTISTAEVDYPGPSLTATGQIMLLLYGLDTKEGKVARSANGGTTIAQTTVFGANYDRHANDIVIRGTQARLVYSLSAGDINIRESSNSGATWSPAALAVDGSTDLYANESNVVLAGGRTVLGLLSSDEFYADVYSRRSL